jgi:glycosyltransferase involved in cell wall biosynthesis
VSVLPGAVIPAYRAADRLAETLAELAPFVARICVVDDASDDATAAVAEAAGVWRVLRRSARGGPGAAVADGLAAQRAAGTEVVVVVDADGQMDPSRIPSLMERILDGADLVRGTRLAATSGGASMPIFRRLGARVIQPLAQWAVGAPLSDPLSGFVALRTDKVPADLWPAFGYPVHLAAAVAAAGGAVVHVPVPARYPRGNSSEHGLHRLPAIAGAIWRARRSRWAGLDAG